MNIIGIETSCDETGIAICSDGRIIAETLYSQIELHAKFGGVVPELASRDHIQKIRLLLTEALQKSGLNKNDIDAIAYTQGPGLIGALMVGASFAKALGYVWGCPTIAINHLEGHILAAMIEQPDLDFPFLSLLVSGGHTMLIEVTNFSIYRILGQTLDDAAGEAFDKTARMLGLGHAGGPVIEKFAEAGIKDKYVFTRPLADRPTLDFSFSGLKTQVLNTINKIPVLSEQDKQDIAYAIQDAIIDCLLIKAKLAIKDTLIKKLVIAGGVGANKLLRERIKQLEEELDIKCFFPKREHCTDSLCRVYAFIT
jgi:N6-L-threonylcarbamoyladenine synthase